MNNLQAKEKLESTLHENRIGVSEAITQVLNTVPKDQIVKSHALAFQSNGSIEVDIEDETLEIHNHALYQFGERASIPRKFIDNFIEEDWRRPILADAMTETFQAMPERRFLTRSVDGQVRGFLSDRFRRLDARPLLDTFAQAIKALGLVPYKGRYNEIKVSIKALQPRVIEIIPNEWVSIGLDWRNSDFGGAANDLKLLLLRLVCINGMVGFEAMREIHLGSKLDESIEWSEETYRLDTRRSQAMLRDAVHECMSPAKLDLFLNTVRKANETEASWAAVSRKIKGSLTKAELEKAKDLFEGPDVVNLPPGRSLWRASNALSWMVHMTDSVDRKLQLERLAGQLVEAA